MVVAIFSMPFGVSAMGFISLLFQPLDLGLQSEISFVHVPKIAKGLRTYLFQQLDLVIENPIVIP
jgi:hypothetical protein